MIVVEDKKYACESCIKGHRSSACKHTDRPLFEVKKKGRPITQCAHCQELRKTRQVHVKCVCEVSEDAPPPPKGKKAKKPLNDAAFPGGIPSELEGVVVTNSVTEGSDSERASSPKACACKTGESCSCCLPRKRGTQSAPAEQGPTTSADGRLASGSHPALPPATKVHYRPVLPRLTPSIGRRRNSEASSSGPLHDPSLGTAHPHSQRQHLVSPYGRAYEAEHGRALPPILDAPLSHIVHEQPYAPPQTPEEPHFEPSWITPSVPPTPFVPSSCGCGAGCTCPGCAEHAAPGSNVSPAHAYDMCMDAQRCTACLQCSIISLSVPATSTFDAPFAGGLASEQMQSVQYPSIDEWVREISQAPPPALVSPYAPDAPTFPEDAAATVGTTSPLFEPQGGFAGWPASGTDVASFGTYLPPMVGYATSEPSAYPPSEPSGYPASESAELAPTSAFTYARSEPPKAYGMTADATQVGEMPFFQNLCRNCGCPLGQCGCDELRPGLTFATSGERAACNHHDHAVGTNAYFEIAPPVPNVFPRSYEGSSSSPASSRRSSHSHSRPVGTGFTPFAPLHVPGQQQNLDSRTFSDNALY